MTIEECIAEVDRELTLRHNTYPHLVQNNLMNPETAAHQIKLMQLTHDILVWAQKLTQAARP